MSVQGMRGMSCHSRARAHRSLSRDISTGRLEGDRKTHHSDSRLYQAYAIASWLKYHRCRSPTRARQSVVSCSSARQEWPSGRAIHILLIASAIRVSHVFPRDCSTRTFVLTICRRRGEAEGLSPAPTTATSDVQNSISTMDAAPSSAKAPN